MGGSFSKNRRPVLVNENDQNNRTPEEIELSILPNSFQNNWIPEEIQLSILPNLPGKSLLRFQCVSKSWSSLISEFNFIHKTPKLILCAARSVFLMDYKEGSAKARRLLLPTKTDPEFVNIRACCNGILWIAVNEVDDFLWNPFTGECKIIPIQPHLLRLQDVELYFYYKDIISDQVYGFGYDHIRKDYQIIIIPKNPSKPLIYSVAKDSFEILEDDIPHCSAMIYWNRTGISMNNGSVVYWPVSYYCEKRNTCVIGHNSHHRKGRGHYLIFGFDFVNRRKILLPQPPSYRNVMNLIEFKGSICAIENEAIESFTQMWLFKEETGKQKNWVKFMSIDLAAFHSVFVGPQIYHTRNEEVLISNIRRPFTNETSFDSLFYAYNPTDKSFRNVKVDGAFWYQVISYNESLATIQS